MNEKSLTIRISATVIKEGYSKRTGDYNGVVIISDETSAYDVVSNLVCELHSVFPSIQFHAVYDNDNGDEVTVDNLNPANLPETYASQITNIIESLRDKLWALLWVAQLSFDGTMQ